MHTDKYPIILKDFDTCQGREFSDFEEDAIRVMGNDVLVKDNLIFDPKESGKAHQDAIQLIPRGKEPNAQMFGAELKKPHIISNTITSNGKLQSIFSSDGIITNAEIINNLIETNSEHKITINGLMSGTIAGNRDASNNPVRVYVDGLRIGGNHNLSFYVLSFTDRHYENITIGKDTYLVDKRGKAWNNHYRYVKDFDLTTFRRISETVEYKPDGFEEHLESTILLYQSETGQKIIC